MARMIRAEVEARQFATNAEVIRKALRASQGRQALHQQRLAVIRAKIQEAIDELRPAVTEEEMDTTLEAMLADARTEAEKQG
jgi:Arc/MetJ-type ribon-helix-helix transcriptional regulator